MTTPLALGPAWLNPDVMLQGFGPYVLVGLCLIVFAECGLLAFFLPGDSLLFTVGLFVAQGTVIRTPLWVVCLLLTGCAFAGNVTGYHIGRRIGPALFNRPDSRFFKQEYVDNTHAFFEKHGPKAIILARFVPIVRTFVTAIAGVGRMNQRSFFTYSAVGAVLWAAGMTVLGYFLGQIPFVHNNIESIFILIVFVSVIPIIIEGIRARRARSPRENA